MRSLKTPRGWIWYLTALVCMVVGFALTPIFTWQYFVAAFLYTLAGGLVWSHVDYKPPRRRDLTLEYLRDVDKEYR